MSGTIATEIPQDIQLRRHGGNRFPNLLCHSVPGPAICFLLPAVPVATWPVEISWLKRTHDGLLFLQVATGSNLQAAASKAASASFIYRSAFASGHYRYLRLYNLWPVWSWSKQYGSPPGLLITGNLGSRFYHSIAVLKPVQAAGSSLRPCSPIDV